MDQKLIDEKYISVREHPDDPDLKIYNYTPKAVYERYWCEETRMARGLIMYKDEIVARPLPKFFNWNEPGADVISSQEEVTAYEKHDGSLGIGYVAPDGKPAIATRGSFTSPQAEWATKHLRSRDFENLVAEFWVLDRYTTLFEIIYPENRIVLDYGDFAGLIRLGVMGTDTGEWHPDDRLLVAEGTYQEILRKPPRPNKEGVVVETGDGRRVKIKQQDYIDLHRIVTNISPKNSWELYKSKGNNYLDDIPNEFHDEVAGHVERRLKAIGSHTRKLMIQYLDIPEGLERKEFAKRALETDSPAFMFAWYDVNLSKACETAEKEALANVSDNT